jgi:hypothetical protein
MGEFAAAVGILTASLAVAVLLARLALEGILRAAFHRVRTLVRRVLTRRVEERRPQADRRDAAARRH